MNSVYCACSTRFMYHPSFEGKMVAVNRIRMTSKHKQNCFSYEHAFVADVNRNSDEFLC